VTVPLEKTPARDVVWRVDISAFRLYVCSMFKTMDQDVTRSLLEGQRDILSIEAAKETAFYSKVSCPICYQIGAEKRIAPPKIRMTPNGPEVVISPFSPNNPLPNGYAHCSGCNTDFDPYTGVIRKTEASMIAGSPTGYCPK
jgi:hypothetical protein